MRILLGLSHVELEQTGGADLLRKRVSDILPRERDLCIEVALVLREGHELDVVQDSRPRKPVKPRIDQGVAQLPCAVRSEVEEDDRVAILDANTPPFVQY